MVKKNLQILKSSNRKAFKSSNRQIFFSSPTFISPSIESGCKGTTTFSIVQTYFVSLVHYVKIICYIL